MKAIPSLDGVRAVAVGLVFFAHSGLEHLIPGGLGVTVFFVLSGYLITTLMRIEHARYGTLDLRAFYLRRVLRLMPPLAIVAAVAGLLAAVGIAGGEFTPLGLLSVLFYFGNYFVIATDFHGIPNGIGVTWSLAVEEHFYLFYPPLALLLFRLARPGSSVATLLAICALVLAWRCALALGGASEAYITMATDTRIDAILIGCVMALRANPWLDPLPPARPLLETAVVLGCLAILAGTLIYRDPFFRLTARYTVQSLAIAPLIYLAVARPDSWTFAWLNWRPVAWLGAVSYTIYLSHQVILFVVQRHAPDWHWLQTTAVTALLTLVAAELMRRRVEAPCARLRHRLHRSAQPARPPAMPTGRAPAALLSAPDARSLG